MTGYRAGSWIAAMVAAVCLVAAPAAANNLVLSVPDYNQFGGAYLNWCAPTAGGNLMGYWEDVRGCTGLADRQVFPATPPFANNPATFQQGLTMDGQIEMGFFMGTQGWANPATAVPPNTIFGTPLPQIGPGVLAYATTGWVDPGSGITKVNFGNAPWNMTAADMGVDSIFSSATWLAYVNEIDAQRPALCSFQTWVNGPTGTTHIVNGQTVHEYFWGTTDPHCVVGVGYLDLNPAAFGQELTPGAGDEWVIAQDNWGTTPQYVAVPFDANWLQNDYVYNIPEPGTVLLLGIGFAGLTLRRRSR